MTGTTKLIKKFAPETDIAPLRKPLYEGFKEVANSIGDADGQLDACEFRAMTNHKFKTKCDEDCT